MRNLLRAVAVSALLIGLSQADAQTICCSGGGGGGAVTFPLLGANGTSAAPSYGFTNGTDSGMYANANGSVTIVGSKPAGAAGGAVALTGGTPSGTAAGGDVNITSGSGSGTGNGGTVLVQTGTGAVGPGTMGAAKVQLSEFDGSSFGTVNILGGSAGAGVSSTNAGGVNITSGSYNNSTNSTGHFVTITGGSGGTGSGTDGGQVNITGGTVANAANTGGIATLRGGSTSLGIGGSVTISGGNATNATPKSGGNVNIVGGTSTAGTPGEVQINGDSSIMVTNIRYQALDPTNNSFFTATRPVLVKAILCRVNAPTGAVATLTVLKAPSGTALSGGTALHTGTFDANGTANTNQTLSLSGTVATLNLAAGDSIGVTTTGTWTTGTGSCTVHMQPK